MNKFLIGAFVASAAMTVAPAVASADATCSFDVTTQFANVQMEAGRPVTIQRVNEAQGQLQNARLLIDGHLCSTPNGKLDATVETTREIRIRSANPAGHDTVVLDEFTGGRLQGPVTFHRPRVVAFTGSGNDTMIINGGNGEDRWVAHNLGLGIGANIDMGGDNGFAPDFVSTAAGLIQMVGNGGRDYISGNTTHIPTEIFGGPGFDVLTVGQSGKDKIHGDDDDDLVFFSNGKPGDFADGGRGNQDGLVQIDTGDTATGFETGTKPGVGKLKATAVKTRVGAKLTLGWTHPKAWKRLRSLRIDVHAGGQTIGTMTLNPKTGKVVAAGKVKLAASDVDHAGKTVSASVETRLPGVPKGVGVSFDVTATDSNGKQQDEVDAARAVI